MDCVLYKKLRKRNYTIECLHLSCIAYTGELSRLAVHTVRLSTFYHFGATIACCTPPRTRWSLPTPINVHQAPPRPFLSHGLLDSRVACIAWTAASISLVISASFSLASIFPSDITIDEKGVAPHRWRTTPLLLLARPSTRRLRSPRMTHFVRRALLLPSRGASPVSGAQWPWCGPG